MTGLAEPLAVTLDRHAAAVPERLFVEAMGHRMTYAEANDVAWRTAGALAGRGFAPGSRVAYLSVEAVKACVVAVPGESLEPAELAAWCASAIPYFASPRFVEPLRALPKNASGKVLKRELRDAF